MKTIKQNILEVKQGYIIHQVNCQGVMAKGIAKSLREKYPKIFQSYSNACRTYSKQDLLGKIQKVRVTEHLTIINMFSQNNYGYNKRFTDYGAFENALSTIAKTIDVSEPIAIPYKIGCGLGGGDWCITEQLITKHLGHHNVTIYKLEN